MECEKEIGLHEEGNLKACVNYRNVDIIYSLAHEMHGEDHMSDYHTWIFNLSSKARISEIIRDGGEYILLKHREKPIGLVCFCIRVNHRPLHDPNEILTIDEWEVC